MPDVLGLSDFTSQTEGYASSDGSSLSTGDLRRRYNFGPRVSELNVAQDPFFRLLNMVSRKPTDDPEFKFSERRPSWLKRYAYVIGHGATSVATNDATIDGGTGPNTDYSLGDTYILRMGSDYKSAGNLTNIYGQSSGAFSVGASGTRPEFFVPGQVIKTNLVTTTSALGTAPTVGDYMLWRIDSIVKNTNNVDLTVTLVRNAASDTYREFASFVAATTPITTVYSARIHDDLEPRRSYVVGSAYAMGSGYPDSWKDEPFSTGFGKTQIFKTSLAMDNSTRATVLKYEPNEWGRLWREKLINHKWDIETACLFSSQQTVDGVRFTEGAVDFISGYGNVFTLTHASKSQDDFLDDMSSFLDPRYNNSNASLFFCDTETFNWMHKLSGLFGENLGAITDGSTTMGRSMVPVSKKSVFGVDMTKVNTPYGDINVVRNVHLDTTQIKILAVNMKYVKWRPLIGNGLNRDTAIYVGVQTLENSGVDRRVDLIQTEGGMQWEMPEAHAYWA